MILIFFNCVLKPHTYLKLCKIYFLLSGWDRCVEKQTFLLIYFLSKGFISVRCLYCTTYIYSAVFGIWLVSTWHFRKTHVFIFLTRMWPRKFVSLSAFKVRSFHKLMFIYLFRFLLQWYIWQLVMLATHHCGLLCLCTLSTFYHWIW